MSTTIELNDTRLDYATIASARAMSGLRLVLGKYAIPGPWREACKGIFHVKGIAYTPVVTSNAGRADTAMGMQGTQSELQEWTGSPVNWSRSGTTSVPARAGWTNCISPNAYSRSPR